MIKRYLRLPRSLHLEYPAHHINPVQTMEMNEVINALNEVLAA